MPQHKDQKILTKIIDAIQSETLAGILAEEFANNMPKDVFEEYETYKHLKAQTRLNVFMGNLILTAVNYAREAVSSTSAEEVIVMSDEDLLKDFNLAFAALHIEQE